jgi:uncharacterized RDD family membrane protein YckC
MALPAGWYPVTGDPPGTTRYWDGGSFTSNPQKDANARSRTGFAKPNSATRWRMATVFSRLAAALIDYGAPVAVVLGVANAMGATMPGRTLGSWTAEPRLLAAIVMVILANSVFLIGLFGTSLGHLLLGLRVVDARDRDRVPGLTRALVRFIVVIPTLPATVMMLVLGKRRGMHDFLTGTAVVYT